MFNVKLKGLPNVLPPNGRPQDCPRTVYTKQNGTSISFYPLSVDLNTYDPDAMSTTIRLLFLLAVNSFKIVVCMSIDSPVETFDALWVHR